MKRVIDCALPRQLSNINAQVVESRTRRRFLRQSLGLGSITALGPVLTACGGEFNLDTTGAVGADSAVDQQAVAHSFIQTSTAPSIAIGSNQAITSVNTPLLFNGGNQGPLITVSDTDGPGGDGTMDGYDLYINAAYGTLSVADGSGAIIYDLGAEGIKIWATLDQLNAALTTLVYVPDDSYQGEDRLSMTVYSSDRLSSSAQLGVSIVTSTTPDPGPEPTPTPAPSPPPAPTPGPCDDPATTADDDLRLPPCFT